MNIQQVKRYWQDNNELLYTCPASQIGSEKVDVETLAFLTTCGFPSAAAPSLSFSGMQDNKLLTPNQIFKIDFDGLDDYLMFGSNGSGDPICIDMVRNNEIVYLNHDNYFERIFINNNVQQFAVCLIIYRDFILSLVDNDGDDFVRRKFSDKELVQLKSEFENTDDRAFSNNSFWTAELDYLLWERNND